MEKSKPGNANPKRQPSHNLADTELLHLLSAALNRHGVKYFTRNTWPLSLPSLRIFQSRFGSTTKALELAGGLPRRKRHRSDTEINQVLLALFQRWHFVSVNLLNSLSRDQESVLVTLDGHTKRVSIFSAGLLKDGELRQRCRALGITYKEPGFGHFWPNWQEFCIHLAGLLFKNIRIGPSLKTCHGVCRPDIYVESENMIIEAMTSSYSTPQKVNQQERYLSINPAMQVEYWCLWHSGELRIHSKQAIILYPEDIIQKYGRWLPQKEILELRRWANRGINEVPNDPEERAKFNAHLITRIKAWWDKNRKPGAMKRVDFCSRNGLPDRQTLARAFNERHLWRILEPHGIPFERHDGIIHDELIEDYRKQSEDYGSPIPMMKWNKYGSAKKLFPTRNGRTTAQRVREAAGLAPLKTGKAPATEESSEDNRS